MQLSAIHRAAPEEFWGRTYLKGSEFDAIFGPNTGVWYTSAARTQPWSKMARRLARLEATSLERVRNWVTTHSLLQAVLLWLSFAMAIIWKGQNGGPIATVNGWFLGMAAGSVVTVATAGAVVIIIFLAAIVIDIALSGDGNEEADRPLGYKAFINSCQPLAVWCVAATWLYAPVKLGLLAAAMWPYQASLAAIWLLPALYSLKYTYATWLRVYWLKVQIDQGYIQVYDLDIWPPQLAYAKVPYNSHTELIESLILAGKYQQAIEAAGATGRQIDGLVTELLAELADADAVATDHLEGDIATQVERRREAIINHYVAGIEAATDAFVRGETAARDDERAAQSASAEFILSQDRLIAGMNARAFLDETERFAGAPAASGKIRRALAFVRSLQQRKE